MLQMQFIETKNDKPLTANNLGDFQKEFKKAFGKNSSIRPETELFIVMAEIWRESASPAERIQEILEELQPEPGEARQALAAWGKFYNSVAQLMNFCEKEKNEQKLIIEDLIAAIEKSMGPQAFEEMMQEMSLYIIEEFFDEFRIQNENPVNQIKQKVDHFFEAQFSEVILILIDYLFAEVSAEDKVSSKLAFRALFYFCVGLDKIRKEKFKIRSALGNDHRKEPCPCGSGLKYGKCCFL